MGSRLKALETAWIIILSHYVSGFDKYHHQNSQYTVLDYCLNSHFKPCEFVKANLQFL